MRSISFAVPFAFALAPLVSAQNPTTFSSIEVVPWGSGPGTGSFTDGAVGDFDDDSVTDALILRGGTLVLAHAVDVFTNLKQIDDGVNAMTPFGADPSVPDGVAAVRAPGLFVYAIDGSSGSIVITRTLLEGGAWAGAVDLQVGDWDGDGYQDLIGLSASRTTVLVKKGTSAGWGTTETLTLPVTMQAFAPLQWDLTDPELEVVLVDQANQMAMVYDHDGYGPLYTRGNGLGRTLIAPFHQVGATYDRVALYMGNATGSVGFLTVFDHIGMETASAFPGEVPFALATHDVLGDDQPDLAITFESSADVLIAENLSTSQAPTFDASLVDHTFFLDMYQHLDMQPAVAANHAPACFGDLDGDGKTDLLLPADGVYAPVLVHGGFGPLEAAPSGRLIHQGVSDACEVGGFAKLDFTFNYPNPDPDVAEFRISVFRQPDPFSPVDPTAISMCPLDLGGVTYHVDDLYLDGFGESWGPSSSNPNVYHLLIRPVDAGGRMADAPLLAAFTIHPNGLDPLYLSDGWVGAYDEHEYLDPCGGQQGNPPSGNPVGGFTELKRDAEVPTGEIPVYGDVCDAPD